MTRFVSLRSGRRFIFVACLLTLAVSGCAHQPQPSAIEAPGFWFGLLHGFIMFFTFVGSFFTDVRIYAFPNSGRWYDFGYLLGTMMFWGGARARGSGKKRDD
ncbi:MAG TPA: hypothetical protein VGR50_04780 [Terriglobales bacterium]|nr:hypothetical protein [Terriglobales bacterium]